MKNAPSATARTGRKSTRTVSLWGFLLLLVFPFGLELSSCADPDSGVTGATDISLDSYADAKWVTKVPDFGEPCDTNEDCIEGWCVPGIAGYECTQTCTEACPEGYNCKATIIDATNATVFLCLSHTKQLCSPCADDAHCPDGGCLNLDSIGGCSYRCESDAECPNGYICGEDPTGEHVGLWCQPETASCSCNAFVDGGIRTCTRGNASGTCYGIQACKTSAGWLVCTAPEPEAELCDGVDNNCNGLIDDNLPDAEPCQNAVDEVGSCVGVQVCMGSEGWWCQGSVPKVEECDAQDNDCDGETDEDFKAPDGSWTLAANCGYCGNDCTTKIPNGIGRCGGESEAPYCVVDTCNEGFFQFNEFQCLPPLDVSCLPCDADLDCFGGGCLETDGQSVCMAACDLEDGACEDGFECLTVAEASFCVPLSESCTCLPVNEGNVRACAKGNKEGVCSGSQTCQPDIGWTACTAATPATESCDGVDNDCDGVIDSDAVAPPEACEVSNEHGVCSGDWYCSTVDPGQAPNWTCSALTPEQDICDYADNDCDGWADEDFREGGTGPYNHLEHCGACNVSCQGAIPNATAGCSVVEGKASCVVASCDPGYFQASPLACLPVSDELCTPCGVNGSCPTPGDSCLELSDGFFCGRDCSADNLHGLPEGVCPDGFACVALPGEVKQCQPTSSACSCLPANEGEKQPCVKTNNFGTCYGQETCDLDAGWVGCTASNPSEEICDGYDNDCNALVDDVVGRGESCVNENANGACVGIMDCVIGQPKLECAAETPVAEVCNYEDDNCDGAIDEGFATLGQGCTEGVGVCAQPGIIVCGEDGQNTECSGQATEPEGSEICDGLDNDCNGLVDDALPEAPLCPNQKGVCKGSVQICAGNTGDYLVCDAGNYGDSYQTIESLCDNLDNDCNGETDEVDIDQDGYLPIACGGSDCNDLNPLVHPGAVEFCGDGLDNDCNNVIDDKDSDGDLHVDVVCTSYSGDLPNDDCNDQSADSNPELDEVCGDDLDNDCDGSIDNQDLDKDKVLSEACGGTDCDDNEAAVHPGAVEVCDGMDNDCNGTEDDKDADGDGHIDEQCVLYPGALPIDDCDDSNVGVNPDMFEVCGNALDEDCSGDSNDKDTDGDTWVDKDPLCGGTDCDDHDPMVYPGAAEVRDGKDNTCLEDGMADEDLLSPGDLVVTEIMYDASPVPDELYEWFEVFNPTARPINLRGWLLRDDPNGKQPEIAIVDDDLVVAPRSYAVLCRTGAAAFNGGVKCDYEFGFLQLQNTADELLLEFNGLWIDEIWYNEQGGWKVAAKKSISLDPDHTQDDNNDPGNWCPHPDGATIASGDAASPGASNPSCIEAFGTPQVVAVHPDNGVDAGGTNVRIIGTGFAGSTVVKVGGKPCQSFEVVSDEQINCVTSSGSPGAATITVQEGAVADTLAAAYQYTKVAAGGNKLSEAGVLEPAETTFVRNTWSERLSSHVKANGITGGACPLPGLEYPPNTLIAEVGFGPDQTHPAKSGAWLWFPAFCAGPDGAASEFNGAVFVPTPGSFSYTFRYSVDGGESWVYTDLNGALNPAGLDALGQLNVL